MGIGGAHSGRGIAQARAVAQAFRPAFDALAAIVLAPACASCGAVLEAPASGPICEACWSSIPSVPHVWRAADGRIDVHAAAAYDGTLRNIIHAWKFERRQSLARPLARLVRDRCAGAIAGADIAVPVPMTPWRKWRRGFNQAEDLAARLGVPRVRALARWRPRPAQATLPSARRRVNLETSVFVPRWRTAAVRGRIVLLVDDVVTTGATIEACAAALGEAGAVEVRAVTVARTMLKSGGVP